jgi:N-methylhydantoinase B/oxoprolinase/acetone carboxylase alpha subunit
VVLRAFEACAASQGCCNNITFGDEKFGYYETVAGGSGAGPTWHGRSGVHVHMTNTRSVQLEQMQSFESAIFIAILFIPSGVPVLIVQPPYLLQ